MIFIKKKIIDKLVRDQFLQPVKDHPYDIFGYVGKVMPCFFSKHAKKKFNKVVELVGGGSVITGDYPI